MSHPKGQKTLLIACVLSLLLHLFFVLFSSRHWQEAVQKAEEGPVEIAIIGDHDYQIADIEPPEREERPKEAKFVGMYDSTVPDEQVAPTRKPSGGSSESPQPVKEKSKPSATVEKDGASVPSPNSKPEDIGKKLAQGGDQDYLNGLTEDYFPNYKIGDRTYLNVLKFPKITYFVRLKKIFKTTFNPAPAIRSYFSTSISQGQVEVVLGVVLDRSGRLDNLFVIRSSGMPAYDQEAIRTIRDSSPFAEPPSELLDDTSRLRMAWTFTVYL